MEIARLVDTSNSLNYFAKFSTRSAFKNFESSKLLSQKIPKIDISADVKHLVQMFTSSSPCPWLLPEDLAGEVEEKTSVETKGGNLDGNLIELRMSSRDLSMLQTSESFTPSWTSFDSSSYLEKWEKDTTRLKVSRQFEIAVMEEIIVFIASSSDSVLKQKAESLLYQICANVNMSKEDFANNTKITVKSFKKVAGKAGARLRLRWEMAKGFLRNSDTQYKTSLSQFDKLGAERQIGLISDVASEVATQKSEFAAFKSRIDEAVYCITNSNPADISVISPKIEGFISEVDSLLQGWYSKNTARRLFENFLRVSCGGKWELLGNTPNLFPNAFCGEKMNKDISFMRIFVEIMLLQDTEQPNVKNIIYQNLSVEGYDKLIRLMENLQRQDHSGDYENAVLKSSLAVFEKPLWKYYALDHE